MTLTLAKRSARTPAAAVIARQADREYTQMRAFAAGGEPEAILTLTPHGRAIGLQVRDRIAADPPLWAQVVDVLLAGLAHDNPKVRFECAHALDSYDDGRAPAHLAPLIDDPVPRVRWMAMHALVCDGCKSEPAPWGADICRRIAARLLSDPSVKVRRHAAYEITRCGEALATETLTALLAQESDDLTRKVAEQGLKRLAA